MVATSRRTRGTSTLGCLVSLVVTFVVLYYGNRVGRVWWRYLELKDRMSQAARFAGSHTDQDILRELQGDVAEIGAPAEAAKFRIVRIEVPRAITIETAYSELIDVPLIRRTIRLKLSVNQRL